MNLLHLEYFCRLAETEHYVKTAESLYISQSNLSYAISSLEKELGVKLFAKKGRNVMLTSNGRIFYEYVRQALSLINEGEEKITANVNQPTEPVVLGVRRIWFLISIMDQLLSEPKRKNIHMSYVQRNDSQILKGLLDGSFGLGLTSQQIRHERISYFPIRDLPFILITPLNHHLALRDSVDLRELRDEHFILRDSSSSLSTAARKLFQKIGITPHVVNEVSSYEVMAHLVCQGMGLGIGTNIPSLRNIHVARIPISYPAYDNILYLAVDNARKMTDGEEYVFSYLIRHHSPTQSR